MKTYSHFLRLKNFLIILLFGFLPLQAQRTFVRVNVAPEHSNWIYKRNEKVKFNVSVTRNNIKIEDVAIRYEIGPDMMSPQKKGNLILENGTVVLEGGTMKEPGFLRCKVVATYEGKTYIGVGTAAFNPIDISPTTTEPNDFMQFWDKAKADAAKIPLDARVRLLPERSTSKTNVYEISFQNYKVGGRIYGILCVPKSIGKFPAILKVPGAGVRAYNGDIANADKGVITLEIGIHGFPVTLESEVYQSMSGGSLNGYPSFNLDNKNNYYYKRVYIGCVRAVDFIYNLPEFDGKNIVVQGQSQGGALAIVTAALDKRIKGLVSFYPALCDMTGYLHNRAGGWPHLFSAYNLSVNNMPQKIETSKYYDVVNFARYLKVPGFYSWGYNDVTCPPTSMYSAYNVITAPKTLFLSEETGHWTYPEQWEKASKFIFEQFK